MSQQEMVVEAIKNMQTSFLNFKNTNEQRVKDLEAYIEKMEAKFNLGGLGGSMGGAAPIDRKVNAEHTAAFMSYLLTGREGGLPNIQASMSSGSDSDGGFTVPYELDKTITNLILPQCVMRDIAFIKPITAANYKRIVNKRGAAYGWVGETDARPSTGTPQLSELDFPAMTFYANPAITQEMLDDSMIDAEQFITSEIADQSAAAQGLAFISGNGVKMPRGILTYPVVANASYAWGSVGYLATGASGAFVAAPNSADILLDLVMSLRPKYRRNGSWLLNSLTLAVIRKMKDSNGRYIVEPSLAAGQPDRLLGYPIDQRQLKLPPDDNYNSRNRREL